MVDVKSKTKFGEILAREKSFVLFAFYTEASDKSKTALEILKNFEQKNKNVGVYSINARSVPDIHPDFGITSVPAVLVFKEGRKINLIYGIQSEQYYENLLGEYTAPSNSGEKKVPRIVVYTSDGCPWCARAKEYLRKLHIPFREINVSRKPAEAERLVKKTGQMGTPQLDINGNFVVGFDKPKIDRFLGIRN